MAWPGEGEPGYVNLHWTSARVSMAGRPFTKLDDFMNFAQWGAVNPSAMKDIYFCLSTQSQVGKSKMTGKVKAIRNVPGALKLKAIWLDVDVKPEKGYATLSAALDAIATFVHNAGLPPPSALVFSGGGVHVYWISDTPLNPAEWGPYAKGLRAEAERLGLKCDYGVTTDAARILRVPGTYNHKDGRPRPVKLAHLGDSYTFATEGGISRLAAIAPTTVTAPVTAKADPDFDLSMLSGKPAAAFLNHPHESLSAGINTHDDTPLNPDAVFRYCPHFQDAALTHGKCYPQGLWMLDMLAATFMDDGRRWGHYLSSGYAGYSRDETDRMYDRKLSDRASHGLGWPSCSAFENEGCKSCKGCAYYQKIRSPLNLAERAPEPKISVAPPGTDPEDIDDLPAGYALDEYGFISEMVTQEQEDGTTVDRPLPLFKSRLRRFKVSGSAEGGAGVLSFQVETNPNVWKDVNVESVNMATEQKLMVSLRAQDVKPNPDCKRRIETFMTSFMAKLDAERKRLDTVPYGWVHEGPKKVGFSYGGVLMNADGTRVPSGIADEVLRKVYTPQGDAEPWFQALKVVTDQKHPALEAIIAMAFASPLMHATGLYNGILHAWSDEGGAHKTTSISIGLAVWANPHAAKENRMTSPKAMLKKLGELKNLPIYWDEINRSEQLKSVQQFLDVSSEGREGLFLDQGRNMRNPGKWQSMVTVGANVSFYEFIKRTTKNTDAQLQRVFEIKVEKRPDTANPLAVSMLIESLNRNYGQIGMRYAAMIAAQPEAIEQYVKDIWNEFSKRVNVDSAERFRAAIAATLYAGAKLANQLGATFNAELLYGYLVEEFLKQRAQIASMTPIAGTYLNTSDALSRFLDTVTRNVMWIDKLPAARGKPLPVNVLAGPKQEDPVFVRCVVADGLIQIKKDRIEAFLQEEGTSVSTVMDGLRRHFKATTKRQVLTAGTNRVGGRDEVVSIPVAGTMLYELCYKHTAIKDRPPEPTIEEAPATTLQQAVTQAAADHAVVNGAIGAADGDH